MELITKNIKVKSYKLNEKGELFSFTTTKDLQYYFPNYIWLNKLQICQLVNFLKSGKFIKIIYDPSNNHLCKVENLPISWDSAPQYKLLVLTWTTGLIFNSDIEVSDERNIRLFYQKYDVFYDVCIKNTDIIVILKDVIADQIPIKY